MFSPKSKSMRHKIAVPSSAAVNASSTSSTTTTSPSAAVTYNSTFGGTTPTNPDTNENATTTTAAAGNTPVCKQPSKGLSYFSTSNFTKIFKNPSHFVQSTFGGGLGANSTTALIPKANESNHNGVAVNNSSTTTKKDSLPPAAAANFNGSTNGHPADARKRDERDAHKETEIETTSTTPNANIIFETVKLSKPPTTTSVVAIDSKRTHKEESVKPKQDKPLGRTVSSSLSPAKNHKKPTTLKSPRARDNCHQQQPSVVEGCKATDKFESTETGDAFNKSKLAYSVGGIVLSKNSGNNNLDNPLEPIYRQIDGIHLEAVQNFNLSMPATPPPPCYSSLPRPTNSRIKNGTTGAFSLPPPLPKQHHTPVTTTKKPTSPSTSLLTEGRYYNNNVHQKSTNEKLPRHEDGDTDNGIDCGVLMGNENCFVVPSISNRHHHQQQQPHQTTLDSNGCNNNASLTPHNGGTTTTATSTSSLRNNFNHIINNNNVVYNSTNKDTTDSFDKSISVPTLPAITSSSVAVISGGSNELHDIKEEVFVVSPSSTSATTTSSSVTTQGNNDLPLYGCATICNRTRNPFLQYPIDTLGRTSIVGSAIEPPTPMEAYNEQPKHVYQPYRVTKTTSTEKNDDLLLDDCTDGGTDAAYNENYVNLDSKVISPEVMDALQLFLQEHGNEYIKQFLQVITYCMLFVCQPDTISVIYILMEICFIL